MREAKTALVLSAGGMFGAYQAGAWLALAEELRPDIVVGASVGALNGLPIAAGIAPEKLIERWLDPESGNSLKLLPNAGWRRGWFDPAPLRLQAERLLAEFVPQVPFGLVVIRLPRLRTVLVKYPHITAAHLQATCSIPIFLPSVRIEGKRFLDGGLLEKMPLWAAVEMGATRIIAIDALPQVGKWWLRAGRDMARMFKPRRRYPAHLEITVVRPSEYLGDAYDAVFWKKANVERWVDLGRRDTEAAMRALVKVA
jgi:NTE family protein